MLEKIFNFLEPFKQFILEQEEHFLEFEDAIMDRVFQIQLIILIPTIKFVATKETVNLFLI